MKEITHSNSEIVFVPYDEAYEEGFEDMPRRVPDITKVSDLVGFRPSMSLDGILEKVVDYQIAAPPPPMAFHHPHLKMFFFGFCVFPPFFVLRPQKGRQKAKPQKTNGELGDRDLGVGDLNAGGVRSTRLRKNEESKCHKENGSSAFVSPMRAGHLLFLVGLVDDLIHIKPYQKLIGQMLGSACFVVYYGYRCPGPAQCC